MLITLRAIAGLLNIRPPTTAQFSTAVDTALGAVLWQLGATDEARVWLQRSAEAGDAEAMTALEVLFDELGDHSDAQAWSQPSA